jgi:hypothetical protein
MMTWLRVPAPTHPNLVARGAVDTDRQLARDVLMTWGLFIGKKDHARLVELLAQDVLSYPDRCKINAIAGTVDALAYGVIYDAGEKTVGVDWDDERVDRYVRTLSARDADRAGKRNRKGWNALDTAAGHFCNAILERDRALALRIARTIVGKYQLQIGEEP